jgi:hypothetical protein
MAIVIYATVSRHKMVSRKPPPNRKISMRSPSRDFLAIAHGVIDHSLAPSIKLNLASPGFTK